MATTKITSAVLDLNAGRADYNLTATNTVTYVSSTGGNQYVFNGAYGTYGVVNGTYVLSSVSSSHPIAIINNGKTSEISYTGAVNEGTGTGPDGNTYTFYSGNVTITVSGNFDTVSYYCLNHGYMGGKDNLIYVSSVGESGLKIPSGTELNRPTAVTGQIRNNTNETSEFSASCEEYYNGTEWKKINNTALPPPLAFKTLLYTGNGSTQSITGVGFQPDLVWIKSRSNTYGNRLIDSTTGPDNYLESNSTAAQQGAGGAGLTSFDSDGFSVGSGNAHNANAATFVAWCFKANGGTTSSNTDGNNTTTVQVFGQAGFSLVKCASITTDPGTFGHGLNAVPKVIIVKRISGSGGWQTYHESIGNSNRIELQSSAAQTGGVWNSTSPTSTVFSYDGLSLGEDFIAYCFSEVAGFSSFGTYTGNGSSSGPTVTTGFQPDFVMTKKTSGTANWWIVDSSRSTSNPRNARLLANTTDAEVVFTPGNINFNSTGFELAGTSGEINGSGETYIYMAFKNNPTPQPAAGYMSFLVIAGGGSGGNENARSGGGAGAGGLRTSYGSTSGGGASAESDITLAAGTYTITVGAGGAGTSSTPSAGNDGSLSSIAASSITTISSVGGGGGGAPGTGRTGGSGGGGAHGGNAGGSGTANQGFAGGTGNGESPYNGAGGGGASAVGANSSAGGGSGAGGDGLSVSIIGSATAYAGGGGGGGGTAASGGTGGGGSGSTSNAGGATANTGGGGGGARTGSGAGGSGVVILRLATSEYSGTTTGSPTVTTDGDYTILTYTGSGTYVHS